MYFTHNPPNELCGTCNYVQSGLTIQLWGQDHFLLPGTVLFFLHFKTGFESPSWAGKVTSFPTLTKLPNRNYKLNFTVKLSHVFEIVFLLIRLIEVFMFHWLEKFPVSHSHKTTERFENKWSFYHQTLGRNVEKNHCWTMTRLLALPSCRRILVVTL